MKNPSLSQKPRNEPASVIPMKQETSLLDWLKETGRLIPRESKEGDLVAGDEDEEISELMEVDDSDLDDDEDMLLDD